MSGPSATAVDPARAPAAAEGRAAARAGYLPTLILTVTLALALMLGAISLVLLVVHPNLFGLRAFAGVVNQQNQNAKTALYIAGFFVVLPLALVLVPRLADAIARGPNRDVLPGLAAGLGGALGAILILVRLSAHLPWGDGLGVLLAGVVIWALGAGALLMAAVRGRPLPRFGRAGPAAALASFGLVLCVTNFAGLSWIPVVAGAAIALALTIAYERGGLPLPAGLGRLGLPRAGLLAGLAIDAVAVIVLLLAVPDTVIFRTSSAIPNSFFPPGIIQFQQDWILGPANQLVHGGALLVGDPVSQYGVGMVYFLAGWFHLAPIGYGTFGALDGILTALVYASAYLILRFARVPRLLAAGALALAVVALIYDLHYPVGALPEQGPLRFGLPMALLLATLAAERWPGRARGARAAALLVLAVSSVWALEGFAYTAFTYLALAALEASCFAPAGARLRSFARRFAIGLAACVCAHVLFALATLIGSGGLPHWGRYFAYLHALLLGGREGSITYGFSRWSPGLAVAAACLASAAAIVLLALRDRPFVRRERLRLIALTGTTAYSIALFSYFDNRSATYLVLYVALPVVMMVVLWLELLVRCTAVVPRGARTGALAFSLAVGVLLVAGAWSTAGGRLSSSALAHFYPGGGLRAAIHRLWHPPPIDPRAPEGARLVKRSLRGERVIVLLPTAQDLSIELLMRADRANALFIGDGYMDSFVPSVWVPVISRQIAALHAGQRLLVDRSALRILAALRANPSIDPLRHPIAAGAAQEEWALLKVSRRFALRPVSADREGFVVAALARR